MVNSCANISSAALFFNTIEALHAHFARPDHHAHLQKIQESLGIKSGGEIGSLSTTRWACRFENCKAVLTNYAAIKSTLEEEISSGQNMKVVEAIGLLNCISEAEFVVCLSIFKSVLSVLHLLSKYFQTKDATLGQAVDQIQGTIRSFEDSRNNFKDIWEEIVAFSEKHDVSLEPIRVSKRKRQAVPKKLDDFRTDTTLGKSHLVDLSSDVNTSEYWKINIYYQVMDNVLTNLKKRFTNLPYAQSIEAFYKLDLKNADEFVNTYKHKLKIDTDLLQAEVSVLKNVLKNKNKESNIKSLKEEVDRNFCPNFYKMLQVAIAIPISSADCERSFSAMRRTKNWLRTTMGQERFSNLAIINIENSLVKTNILPETVLNKFCDKNRKLKLV